MSWKGRTGRVLAARDDKDVLLFALYRGSLRPNPTTVQASFFVLDQIVIIMDQIRVSA